MTPWPEIAGIVGASLAGSVLLASAAVCTVAVLPRSWLPGIRQALLALLLPAVCLTVSPGIRLAVRHSLSLPAMPIWPPVHLLLGVLPVLLLPLLGVLARMPAGQRRAAAGLGARGLAMLRLVWLPQLGPSVLLGLLLAALLDLAAVRLSF